MKTIILVRHAKAAQAEFGMLDFDRPLMEKGKRDAVHMGQKIKKRGISPSLILSSPAKRAKKTAKLVAKQIGYPKEQIRFDKDIYDSNAEYLIGLLRTQDDQDEAVMIFGHNPDLSLLADILLSRGTEFEGLPTSGVCCVEFDVGKWSEIKAGQGKTLFIDYPNREET